MVAGRRGSGFGRAALRVWLVLYGWGYGCFKAAVWMVLRPAFRVRRIGPMPRLPRCGPLIVCANHGSYLDPAFLQVLIPRRVKFMMTNDWYRRPAVRWFFRLAAAIPLDGGRMAHQGMRVAIDALRAGRVVGIFPEGRLTRDGSLGPGQRGVAILARMAGAPVLPVGISGSYQAWPRGVRWPRPGDVRLAFGPLLRWDGPTLDHDREHEHAFVARVMEEVRHALERLDDPAGRLTSRAQPGR